MPDPGRDPLTDPLINSRRLVIVVEPASYLDDETDPMAVAEYMLTASGEYSIPGRLIDAQWEDTSDE